MEAPQDLLVFIPPWKMIEKKAVQLYPEIFSGVENEVQFEQIILEYMEIDGPRTIRPAINGQEVYSLLEISSDAQVFLNFINKIEKKIDFALPTSRDPKLGYTTFDAREFIDEKDGKLYKERHIGHKIVSIEYE